MSIRLGKFGFQALILTWSTTVSPNEQIHTFRQNELSRQGNLWACYSKADINVNPALLFHSACIRVPDEQISQITTDD